MAPQIAPMGEPSRLSEIYDDAVVEIYRYLRSRCGSTSLAEDLTSATFVQAALEIERAPVPDLSVRWLITVARNKLIDHWRREAMVERKLTLLDGGRAETVDPWNDVLDEARAHAVLQSLTPDHRAALTLRYLDDLSVPECAAALGRSVHAAESLLARARNAFRTAYEQTGGHDD
ncbi:MAG: RNA polymerase sigma factor [Actinomycetota bacterium]